MKESDGEDLASHSGLESYADRGNAVGVASARGTGRPAMDSETTVVPYAGTVVVVEGNTRGRD